MKILITSAASAQAYQLRSKLTGHHIVLGDHAELPTVMLSSGDMIVLPNPADASYAHKMLTLSLDNEVQAIYALQTTEYDLLTEAGLLFNEYGINLYRAGDEIQ